ncbi:MAG: tRNA (adenosine(37)-N6)-threonylcarbamoyltransferase complex ATPase subunit type 1 TsaE [Acidobacteriota bacterium]
MKELELAIDEVRLELCAGADLVIISRSPQETFELAHRIGRDLTAPHVFLLQGDLGAGKTVFAKGLICGLGLTDPNDVTSPTFTLINQYEVRFRVYHVDLYRLEGMREIQTLELEEVFGEEAVTVIEWAQKLPPSLVSEATEVRIEDLGGDSRRIRLHLRRIRTDDGGKGSQSREGTI